MSFDNRQFNVNGPLDLNHPEAFKAAITLAFDLEGHKTRAHSWAKTTQYGLVFLWSKAREQQQFVDFPEAVALPVAMDHEATAEMAVQYLLSDEAKRVELEKWEQNADHDGHNGPGWRVYLGEWGHVGPYTGVICAVKRIFVWYGK